MTIVKDIKLKLVKALRLIAQGKWNEIRVKVQGKFIKLLDPFEELYWIGHDALVSFLWGKHQQKSNLSPDFVDKFETWNPAKINNSKKNIIWIMLDALRQDIFDEYLKRGGFSYLSPGSAYFRSTFAQGSWTYPSVFSFVSGLYPFNCGVSKIRDQNGYFYSQCGDFDETTRDIFGILRDDGYQIASILDGWGFTIRTTAGQEHHEDEYFEKDWGCIYGQNRRFIPLNQLRDASISFIRDTDPEKPFFLFVRSLFTHSPYRDIFKSSEYVTELSRRRWKFRLVEGFLRGLKKFESQYLARLYEEFHQLDQIENTIIIICSDHGDMFWNVEDDLRLNPESIDNEEIWRHQLEPYNALLKVPLFIWGASLDGVFTSPVRLEDIVPTICDEVGIQYNPLDFDGVSLQINKQRPIYGDSSGSGYGGISYQDGGSKLMMSQRLGHQAYPISETDYERIHLRHDADAALISEFREFLYQNIRQPQDDGDDGQDVLMRRLRDLGYLE